MIKNRKMDHIGLAVTDLNAAAKWYMDVLGFERIGADRLSAFYPVAIEQWKEKFRI